MEEPPLPTFETDLPEYCGNPGWQGHHSPRVGENLASLEGSVVAATGWGGDEYRIYWNGTDVAFAYLYQGDSTDDTTELAASLTTSIASSMAVGQAVSGPGGTTFGPGDDFAAISLEGSRLLFVAAADPLVGAALFADLQGALSAG